MSSSSSAKGPPRRSGLPPLFAACGAPARRAPNLGFGVVKGTPHGLESRRRLVRHPCGEKGRHPHQDVVQVGADPDRVGCRLGGKALFLRQVAQPVLQALEWLADGHREKSRREWIPLVRPLVRVERLPSPVAAQVAVSAPPPRKSLA